MVEQKISNETNHLFVLPWSSVVVGDEGCIGPSRKLLCIEGYGFIRFKHRMTIKIL